MRQMILLSLIVLVSPKPGLADEPGSITNSEFRYFKGNLHTHSLWSDGNDFPDMIAEWYQRQGYHFLALSDHNTLSQGPRWMSVKAANARAGQDVLALYKKRFGDDWVETRVENGDLQVRLKPLGEFRHLVERAGEFLMIQGEEITDAFQRKPIHMNASNLLELVKPQGGTSVPDTMANNLKAVEEQAKRLGRPILTHLNHPNFGYAITAEELAMVTKERFFEVYNGHPDVHHEGDATHASVESMWDIINTLRIAEMHAPPVYGLATDDSHNYFGKGGSSPGRGWIMVRSRFLTPEPIIQSIQRGDFYASSGVTLRSVTFDREKRTIEIAIEPHNSAKFTTRFVGTTKDYDRTRRPVTDEHGKPLPVTQRYSDDVGRVLATVEGETASYTFKGDELYVRAVVSSSLPPENPSFPGQVAQAWTQPVGWETHLPEDFTNVDPKALGLEFVQVMRDPESGFVVGGKNPTESLAGLKSLNGQTIADLEQAMRPGAAGEGGSDAGFLGLDESLRDVLIADNTFVVDTKGLTHQEMARPMLLMGAIARKVGEKEFLYRGRRFQVTPTYFRGYQLSPFGDGTRTDTDLTVTNLDTGKTLKYSLLVPQMIERYGFYEGKGTSYRVEPEAILEVFDFLGKKPSP